MCKGHLGKDAGKPVGVRTDVAVGVPSGLCVSFPTVLITGLKLAGIKFGWAAYLRIIMISITLQTQIFINFLKLSNCEQIYLALKVFPIIRNNSLLS